MKLVKNLGDARQAIVTRYMGPTCYKGSRIKAICDARSVTVNWSHELNVEENHARAAAELMTLLAWNKDSRLVIGGMPSKGFRAGYVFVQVGK